MLSLYRFLLRLYPRAYRHEFGVEMLAVFREAQTETWKKGVLARGVFCAREVAGLLRGALGEHLQAIAGSDLLTASRSRINFTPTWSGSPTKRRFTMRSEFRFPKATAPLMALILALIVVAIEKAKAIQASLPHTNPHVGPIQPAQFTLFSTLVVVLAITCAAGLLGWAILFAIRRSGLHRLSEFNPSERVGPLAGGPHRP